MERGFISREKKRVLGFIPMTTLPATDSAHEAKLPPASAATAAVTATTVHKG